MRIINFKTLKIKNFLSYGDVPSVVHFQPGVNAITGHNLDKEDSKNGNGKSSLLDALVYCLYGTTLREVGKDFVQNSFTKKRCEVSLEFEVIENSVSTTYKVQRRLNPTKCKLFKNEEEVTRSTQAKTNDLIQQVVHTPFAVFKNSVIMSVNTALPFMALPKTDKRKFIESVLGLEVFTQMVLKAREEYSNSRKDYDIAYNKLTQYSGELEFNESQYANHTTNKQQRISLLEGKKDSAVRDLQDIEQESIDIKEHNKQLAKIKKIVETVDAACESAQEKLALIRSQKTEQLTDLKHIKRQRTVIESDKDVCPSCKRSYSEEHVEHAENALQKLNEEETECNNHIQALDNQIQQTEEKIQEVRTLKETKIEEKRMVESSIQSDKEHQIRIHHLKTIISDTIKELEHIQNEKNELLESKIMDLSRLVNEHQSRVDLLNEELNVLETVRFIISEEGIKSFIVKKILQVLNARIVHYLKKLEANCLCKFNEFFEEEILDEGSNYKSYFNFSAGERKRIDLACLFAFADIRRLQGDVNFSTVFYDELLDSSLDDRGVLLTLRLLRERFDESKEACYIITHRGPEVLSKAEHVIKVVKQNGVSKLVE